jgi:hypothetical protein
MRFVSSLVASAVVVQFLATSARGQVPVAMKTPAPEVQGIEAWINSRPLALKDLRGKVVVLHFWTFG